MRLFISIHTFHIADTIGMSCVKQLKFELNSQIQKLIKKNHVIKQTIELERRVFGVS